jgi:phosphoglycolate phosphatase
MIAPRIDAVAFDLDGTLVDTAPGVTCALNGALARSSLRGFDVITVRGWIGGGPDALIQRALEALRPGDGDSGHLASALRRDFDALTLEAPLADGAAFDGIDELLSLLTPRYPIVVVTNKPTELARAVLKDAGLMRHIGAVFGADQPVQRKPAPALLHQAIAHLRVAPERLVMVGDAAFDMQAASAAGSPAAWARWGYAPEAPKPMPRWTLDAPLDLLKRLHGTAAATPL